MTAIRGSKIKVVSATAVLLCCLFFVALLPMLSVAFLCTDSADGMRVVVIPFALAIVVAAAFTAAKSPYHTFKVLLIMVVFQEIGLIILSNYLSSNEIWLLTLSKDIFALFALLVFALKGRIRRLRHTVDWLALIFIAITGLNALRSFGSVPLFVLAATFKQNVMLFVLFFLGRLIFLTDRQVYRAARLLINIGLLVAVFGFFERFLLGDEFWINIGIHELARDRGVYEAFLYNSKYQDTAGGIFYFVGNLSLRRLASFSAQPPLTAYFLALPLILLFFAPVSYSANRLKVNVAKITIGTALLLTLGRGGIVIATIAFLAKYWKKNLLKLLGIVVLLFLVYLGSSQLQYVFTLGGHGNRHLSGLQYGLTTLKEQPLGYGLGTGGNYAAWFGDNQASSWESYIGALGYQMGIIGLIVFMLFFVLLFYELYWRKYLQVPLIWRKLSEGVGIAVLGLLVASLFAEAAVGFLSSGFYPIFAGMMLSQIDRYIYRRKNHGISAS